MAEMTPELLTACDALGSRIAASLGQMLGVPYEVGKVRYAGLLRAEVERHGTDQPSGKELAARAEDAAGYWDDTVRGLEKERDEAREEAERLRARLVQEEEGTWKAIAEVERLREKVGMKNAALVVAEGNATEAESEVERLRAELATVAADTLRRFADVIDNGPAVTGKKAIELPPRVYSDLARKEADRAAGRALNGAEADRG